MVVGFTLPVNDQGLNLTENGVFLGQNFANFLNNSAEEIAIKLKKNLLSDFVNKENITEVYTSLLSDIKLLSASDQISRRSD